MHSIYFMKIINSSLQNLLELIQERKNTHKHLNSVIVHKDIVNKLTTVDLNFFGYKVRSLDATKVVISWEWVSIEMPAEESPDDLHILHFLYK